MSGSDTPSALRVRIFQHVPFEGPAAIGEWLESRGHVITTTRFYDHPADAPLPHVEDYDWLVVMGGPMSVNDGDDLPWIAPERRCIRDAVSAGKTVLGICLGAQLIASALGAEVYPNYYREIGWFPVSVETGEHDRDAAAAEQEDLAGVFSLLPATLTPLHWHGETFSLPAGAELLARSDACVNQAFAVGDRVLGLQFHLEATPQSLEELIRGSAEDLDSPGPYVAGGDDMLNETTRFEESNRHMRTILSYLEEATLADRKPDR